MSKQDSDHIKPSAEDSIKKSADPRLRKSADPRLARLDPRLKKTNGLPEVTDLENNKIASSDPPQDDKNSKAVNECLESVEETVGGMKNEVSMVDAEELDTIAQFLENSS